MKRPDIRQRVIEAVLDLAAAAGVDDVHLIAALALHRRMTEDELRQAVGDRVYDAFAVILPACGAILNEFAISHNGTAINVVSTVRRPLKILFIIMRPVVLWVPNFLRLFAG